MSTWPPPVATDGGLNRSAEDMARKSFGRHTRVTVSKSGVGWSVGGKGARYTHRANGRNSVTVKPLSVGGSRRRRTRSAPSASNDGSGCAVLFLIGIGLLAVAGPGMAAAAIAKNLGAVGDVANGVGWVFRVAIDAGIIMLIVHYLRSKRARTTEAAAAKAAAERAERRRAELTARRAVLGRIETPPTDITPSLPEENLAVMDRCALVTSTTSANVPVLKVIDSGSATVTTRRIRFTGAQKTTEWEFRRLERVFEDAGCVMIVVSNRKQHRGVRVAVGDAAALTQWVRYAQALAGNALPGLERELRRETQVLMAGEAGPSAGVSSIGH